VAQDRQKVYADQDGSLWSLKKEFKEGDKVILKVSPIKEI